MKPTFAVNGTHYTEGTDPQVVRILESYRGSDSRLVVYYGDRETGRMWGDKESGYVGRSTGRTPIPLIVANSRSMGGGGILTDCVVRIETARGKRVLWQHEAFHNDGKCGGCGKDRADIVRPCRHCRYP